MDRVWFHGQSLVSWTESGFMDRVWFHGQTSPVTMCNLSRTGIIVYMWHTAFECKALYSEVCDRKKYSS